MDKTQAIETIRGSSVSGQADLLTEFLLPSARIVVEEDGHESANVSHFGGRPFLPAGTRWPIWDKREFLNAEATRLEEKFQANPRDTGLRDIAARMRQEQKDAPKPLLFLGQLFLSEMGAAALPKWPRDGTLVFFYDPSTWGFDPLAHGHAKVLYFPADEILVPTSHPRDFAEEGKFPHRRITFNREWTLPTRISAGGRDLSVWGNDDYAHLCAQLMGSSDADQPVHRCGGHPQEIQNDMRLECQLVTYGIYCGDRSGYEDPRRFALEEGAADWQLLIQIDSDQNRLGWMWGDAGRVYFWNRRQEIEAAVFDGSWAILQCY